MSACVRPIQLKHRARRTRRHRLDGRRTVCTPRVTRCCCAGTPPRESIEVRPDDGDPIVVPGPGAHRPADVDGPVDVVLLAVKDTQNEQAAGWLARLCDEHTVVCALQNGVEQVERVGRFCPSSTVVPARGVVLRRDRSPRAGCGCAPGRGWCCPTPTLPRQLAELLRGTGVTRRARSRLRHRGVAQAAGQRRRGFMVLTGRRIGHVPPRRRRRAGAPISGRMSRRGAGRGRRPRRRGHRRDRRHVRRGARGHDDVDAHRPRSRQRRWSGTSATASSRGRPPRHGLATPISDVLVPLLAAASDGPG